MQIGLGKFGCLALRCMVRTETRNNSASPPWVRYSGSVITGVILGSPGGSKWQWFSNSSMLRWRDSDGSTDSGGARIRRGWNVRPARWQACESPRTQVGCASAKTQPQRCRSPNAADENATSGHEGRMKIPSHRCVGRYASARRCPDRQEDQPIHERISWCVLTYNELFRLFVHGSRSRLCLRHIQQADHG
jgi:hypothetical protein